MITIRRVVGQSMEPTLRAGQMVFAIKRKNYKPGDVVIAKLGNKEVVKRISAVSNESITLLGDNLNHSTDSRAKGPIKLDNVKGKMIFVL